LKNVKVMEIVSQVKALGYKIDITKLENDLKEYFEFEKEARSIRRKMADWKFINSQKEPRRTALIVYVETGDLKMACKLADMILWDFVELLRKSNIPIVL